MMYKEQGQVDMNLLYRYRQELVLGFQFGPLELILLWNPMYTDRVQMQFSRVPQKLTSVDWASQRKWYDAFTHCPVNKPTCDPYNITTFRKQLLCSNLYYLDLITRVYKEDKLRNYNINRTQKCIILSNKIVYT